MVRLKRSQYCTNDHFAAASIIASELMFPASGLDSRSQPLSSSNSKIDLCHTGRQNVFGLVDNTKKLRTSIVASSPIFAYNWNKLPRMNIELSRVDGSFACIYNVVVSIVDSKTTTSNTMTHFVVVEIMVSSSASRSIQSCALQDSGFAWIQTKSTKSRIFPDEAMSIQHEYF